MTSKPTVLHVAAVEFTATRFLYPQLEHLRSCGYRPVVACAPETTAFDESLAAFEPRVLRFPRSIDVRAMVTGARDLRRLLDELSPDIVHFHSPAAAIPGRLGVALRRRAPRVVYTVHGFLHQWNDMGLQERAVEAAERVLSHRTDLMMFQSQEDFDAARRRHYGSRLRYLGNGVGDEWFVGPRPSREPHGPLRLAYVGRLSREKGVLELIEAMVQVPDATLVLIGAAIPSDRDGVGSEARSLATRLGLDDRVRFAGMLPGTEVRAALLEADVFVLPSWREGVPRSLIEAMATGLPAVATAIRGCRELVEPGHNGWIVPARRPDALAAALRQAAGSPPEVLAALGRAAFERADSRHRESLVFDRLVQGYTELGFPPA